MRLPERLHSIDAVRAFALLSGIVLHAAMSFLPGFDSTGFPIIDQSPSIALGVLFFVIHSFRMSLFFFIAGYFARMQFHRLGLRAFIWDRGKRIALPLIVGWPILFPLILIPIILAAGQRPPATVHPPPRSTGGNLAFPLIHLWFLYFLLLLYPMTLIIRAILVNMCDRAGQIRSVIDWIVREIAIHRWGVLILACPTFAALVSSPSWVPWLGIPTPDTSLIPNAPALITFFIAFGFGWLVQRQPQLLAVWKAQWKSNLALAFGLSAASLAIAGPLPQFESEEISGVMLVYAACYPLSSWCWIFAVMGLGLRFFPAPNWKLRYLADSSYWLYLIHLPLIFLAQAVIMNWNLHWSIKFPLILLVTVPLMLVSYHYCVRATFIGALLNGRRYQRTLNPETSSKELVAPLDLSQ